jgi:site-specific recombinase XerD
LTEVLPRTYKAPTAKQHLAAIRMLFDWLIVGQVVGQNPAAAVSAVSPCFQLALMSAASISDCHQFEANNGSTK